MPLWLFGGPEAALFSGDLVAIPGRVGQVPLPEHNRQLSDGN
jgi:hypothetical protein